MDYPKFKYSPNAYKLDLFISEKGICSVCEKERELKYDGPFYSREEPSYICPWCIADGSASLKYDGSFNDYESVNEGVISNEQLLEVEHKTPAYRALQNSIWLSHCGEPCVFIGYVTEDVRIDAFIEEVADDIWKVGIEIDEAIEVLDDGSIYLGYLFQCKNCGKHRLHIDFT